MTVDGPNNRHFQFPTPPPDSDPRKHTENPSSSPTERTRDDVAPLPELSAPRKTPKLAAGWLPDSEAGIRVDVTEDGGEHPVRTLSPARLKELVGSPTTFVPPEEVMTDNAGRQRAATITAQTGAEKPAPMSRTASTPSTRRTSRSTKPPPLELVKSGGVDDHDESPIVHQEPVGLDGTDLRASGVDEMTPPRKPRLRRSNPSMASALPPLPFHSYLSLTLGSPTSVVPNRSSPLALREPETQVYGIPPHHPDDSGAIALERIINFFCLPPKLEGALMFGLFACLDSWLYIFTILPLRFLKALGVLIGYWKECIVWYFSYDGKKLKKPRAKGNGTPPLQGKPEDSRKRKSKKSASDLMPSHKADIMRGMVLFTTCWVLMSFDASRIYHSVRGQSGIKLYVIYNMLDFGDRLCAALGQDIFECLFSSEILDRRPDGRSKIWRPFGIFLLALGYNILHSIVLFYQVITLNVAVNSYSNALVTLLLSVQFVEIKATVFKRFDKENLFQLTCADIVERFQLLLMLTIIWTRNLVEMGVWSLSPTPGSTSGILPKSFTFFPTWTGKLMGPFFMVLGSEMLVDWLKHAYITKFNNMRPILYERFLDVQCKDYYTHAFTDQNLTKRLGLPVLPLASLFIRSTIQTYHMFLATHVPIQPPTSTTTSLSESEAASPSSTSSIGNGFDNILRRALSRSPTPSHTDDFVAAATMAFFLLACFLVFLAVKLVLGITLLRFARNRYRGIRERDRMHIHTGGKPGGAFGVVQVGEEQRLRIFEGDPKGERGNAERNRRGRESEMKTEMDGLERAERYKMVSKRIW